MGGQFPEKFRKFSNIQNSKLVVGPEDDDSGLHIGLRLQTTSKKIYCRGETCPISDKCNELMLINQAIESSAQPLLPTITRVCASSDRKLRPIGRCDSSLDQLVAS